MASRSRNSSVFFMRRPTQGTGAGFLFLQPLAGLLVAAVAGALEQLAGADRIGEDALSAVVEIGEARAGQHVVAVARLLVELDGLLGIFRDAEALRIADRDVVAAARQTRV